MLENRGEKCWVEPFAGGMNVIDKVSGLRIANDDHYYLIALFEAVSKGWEPPSIVLEEEYNSIRTNQNTGKYPPYLVGFVGFGCSYSGKWWGGYARGNDVVGRPRNYANESKRNLLKQAPKLNGITFVCGDYRDLIIPENAIVYADPPYANTTRYKSKFDHVDFWNWCRRVRQNHRLYISEYNAPDDFTCIWSKKVNNTLVADTGSKQGIEKLWI